VGCSSAQAGAVNHVADVHANAMKSLKSTRRLDMKMILSRT
jgi:hypothetical protein